MIIPGYHAPVRLHLTSLLTHKIPQYARPERANNMVVSPIDPAMSKPEAYSPFGTCEPPQVTRGGQMKPHGRPCLIQPKQIAGKELL